CARIDGSLYYYAMDYW
nr:immunoglobulin heavy chain junction region [Mus musculus]